MGVVLVRFCDYQGDKDRADNRITTAVPEIRSVDAFKATTCGEIRYWVCAVLTGFVMHMIAFWLPQVRCVRLS